MRARKSCLLSELARFGYRLVAPNCSCRTRQLNLASSPSLVHQSRYRSLVDKTPAVPAAMAPGPCEPASAMNCVLPLFMLMGLLPWPNTLPKALKLFDTAAAIFSDRGVGPTEPLSNSYTPAFSIFCGIVRGVRSVLRRFLRDLFLKSHRNSAISPMNAAAPTVLPMMTPLEGEPFES